MSQWLTFYFFPGYFRLLCPYYHLLLLDFAKAFDKVSHAHLLYKLECYGIKGQILTWLRDFLTSRKQRVVIEGQASDWLNVTSGVPQGLGICCSLYTSMIFLTQ